jgi:hypothetical protein
MCISNVDQGREGNIIKCNQQSERGISIGINQGMCMVAWKNNDFLKNLGIRIAGTPTLIMVPESRYREARLRELRVHAFRYL